jgi:hypothetical protein
MLNLPPMAVLIIGMSGLGGGHWQIRHHALSAEKAHSTHDGCKLL